MNASYAYPSFDGPAPTQWTMVAPQHSQYYGAQYDHVYAQHQASLLQAAAQQQHAAAAAQAYAAHPAYAPAPQFYQQQQQFAEPARSRFAFAHAPAHFEQPRFNLPPPAMHATQQQQQHHYGAVAPAADEYMRAGWDAHVEAAAPYGHAESASRATLESEHLSFLLGRLAQSADFPSPEDEYDHPSHSRPPVAMQQQQDVDIRAHQQQQHVTYDLIPNVSSVPPPPPVERSAVPLADLAAEMVWETCRQGYLHALETAQVAAPVAANPAGVIGQPPRAGPRRSAGGEQFGVIGSGRARKSLDGYDSSSSSSPASSIPGTPLVDYETLARRQRLADLGLASFNMNGSTRSRASRAAVSPFPAEPSPAFRAFVKQILTATLVTPEDLVYALALVSQVPVDKIIPPTPAEPGQDAQTTSFKAAPFKIVLGALMIANKSLQDNSYRNETFSTVSGIPLPDVNALEAHVLLALNFDVAIHEDKWASWLAVVVDRVRSGKGELGDRFAVQDALERLVRSAVRHSASPLPSSPVLAAAPVADDVAMAAAECPSTPLNHPEAVPSFLDLDASGPLESPMRPGPIAVLAGGVGAKRAQRPSLARPARLGHVAAGADSPLVGRSRSCRAGLGDNHPSLSLFPPVDLGGARSRSFGHELARNVVC
ncbi:hypothetical protein JCM8097_004149 [Rhodosporidiobolus ruineniae]